MKILQLITSLETGGAEKLIVDCVPLYQEKGHEVDVLLLSDRPSDFRNALAQKTRNKVWGLTKGSVYNPLLIFKIMPYLKQYEVVHVHLFPALYWAVFAKWLSFSKVNLVYTEHNTSNKRRDVFLLKTIDKWVYRGIRKLITIAEEVDANLKAYLRSIPVHRFVMINNGVDVHAYRSVVGLDKRNFFSDDDFVLIQVSSFRAQKDQATLLRALARLPEAVKLLLVGDGPLRGDSEVLAAKLDLGQRVQFLGNRNDVAALLQMADVAVLSSFHEGLSLSSVEGMATNPFVASDVPGLREIVKDYGVLFPQGDAEALAVIINRLRTDAAFYDAVKSRCLARASQFDIQLMIAGYLEVYQEVITGKPSKESK